MPTVFRQLIRTGMCAFALILVLLATTGIHFHFDHIGHADHDHHAVHAEHDHDHDDNVKLAKKDGAGDNNGNDHGHDGLLFHSHSGAVSNVVPHVINMCFIERSGRVIHQRPLPDFAPDNPARDIDPPPNKYSPLI